VRHAADRFERLELPRVIDRVVSVIDVASKADPKKPYHDRDTEAARTKMRQLIAARPDDVRKDLLTRETKAK
jgi:hypothetical protein